jgi:hypothetical protein
MKGKKDNERRGVEEEAEIFSGEIHTKQQNHH